MTTITFRNDEDRANFQFQMALMVLKQEVQSTLGIRMYRGNILDVLKRFVPNLPRTRKSAYKFLVEKGYYNETRN
tara:strand:- start:392 stop:616 length:225 start_codon:yes stop_codon:yes gene_type:complete